MSWDTSVSALFFAVGKQQWGVAKGSSNSPKTNFPISFKSNVFRVINTLNKDTSISDAFNMNECIPKSIALSGFTIWVNNATGAVFDYIAIGVQQWGYVSHNAYRSDTPKVAVFPIAFTKTIYAISTQLHMTGVRSDVGTGPYISSYSNSQMSMIFNIEHSGVTMDGAWWMVIGIQQWGVDYGRATGKQINYPIAFSKFAKVVAVDGFNASSRYSKAVLYEEPSLAYFKFTYDAETAFVNYIAIGIQQWGSSDETNRDTTVTFPVAFSVLYSVVAVPKSSSVLSGSNSNFGVKSQNNKSFIANMYDSGNGYAGFNWCAFGKAQPLPMDIHQKPA